MALLKRFENAEFGQLSVIVKDGKEYMDGIHVATMLGYLNPRDAIARHCTEAGVVFHDTGVVTGKKAISLEEKLDLYKAIDLLKPKYKTVIILKYFDDMKIEDISYVLDVPINTVKSHLKRAKESLSDILKEGI